MIRRTLVLALAVIGLSAAAAPAVAGGDDGKLTCFPHGPGELRYDDTWGAARSGGRRHQGTDLLSPKGTPVLAAAPGEVVGLENGTGSGYYVRLAHEGGWETYYMHLDNDTPGTDDGAGGPKTAFAPGLEVGDRVFAGELIGRVGDSGNAEGSGSHTHFELHIDGTAVNPYPYLVEVETRLDELRTTINHAATASGPAMRDIRNGWLWRALVADPTVDCLSRRTKKAIHHVFGQLPRERVLLTGVVAG